MELTERNRIHTDAYKEGLDDGLKIVTSNLLPIADRLQDAGLYELIKRWNHY